jgi:hypothetical protein
MTPFTHISVGRIGIIRIGREESKEIINIAAIKKAPDRLILGLRRDSWTGVKPMFDGMNPGWPLHLRK